MVFAQNGCTPPAAGSVSLTSAGQKMASTPESTNCFIAPWARMIGAQKSELTSALPCVNRRRPLLLTVTAKPRRVNRSRHKGLYSRW